MILDEIVAAKREELEITKSLTSLEKIRQIALKRTPPLNLAVALRQDRVQLIAEVKKASPSLGLIRADFDPVKIARIYANNNAAAISVLTEIRYFQGSLDYLSCIERTLGGVRPPLLRKDFIFDPYQVYESRAYGADAILLIAAILDSRKLAALLDLSHDLNMQCLVEVHNVEEIDRALKSGARIIGINNRDLKTFKVDLNTTAQLRPLIVPTLRSGSPHSDAVASGQTSLVEHVRIGGIG